MCCQSNEQVWKPKAIRDKEAAEALTATPAVAYDATATAETRVILPGGPTVVEESTGDEQPVASVKAEEPAQSDVAEVKAVPPKPKIEWLVAEEEPVSVVAPLVVEAETPKEEAVHDHFETAADTLEEATALEAKSDPEPVAYTAPAAVTTLEEVKAAPEPVIAHEPVVQTVAEETKAAPEEPIAVVNVAPVEEINVAPVVATEEKKEYGATALVEKTETEPLATYPTANVAAEEEVVKSEPIATVDTHHTFEATVDAEESKTVGPVVEEVVATVPVADLTVEEQVVEIEPEIVPVEAAPVVIVLDEPAAAIVEAIVPSTKTETISY